MADPNAPQSDEESALVDGCDFEVTEEEAIADSDLDAFVLFADVAGDDQAVEARRLEYEELFADGA